MSEPRRTGLLNMLGSSPGCQFVIPVYQRNYTWIAEKEVKQYLTDLDGVLEGKYNNHFLGIIIYLEKSIDFSTREFSVIDGQQRLTTTFLIIYAIKQILKENGNDERVKQLEGQYLTNPYHSDKIKFKLKPLVSDDDVYRCIVDDRIEQVTDKDSKVLKNYLYIKAHLDELLLNEYSENDILLALDKLYIVTVPISESDNAQKIFESINATAAKLTAADLIRNYLLMDLDSDTQERYYIDYWKKIELLVSHDSKILEMFFRMFLAIKTFTLVSKNSVYREFVKWREEKNVDINNLLEELLEYANIFNLLYNIEQDKVAKELNDSILDFRKIKSDIPMSAVMEFYYLYRKNKITVGILNELISSINAYLIRRSICDIDAQNISKLFPAVLKRTIEKCNGDYSSIKKIMNQELVGNTVNTSGSYMPTDKQMMEVLHTANVYKRPALRIILDRLELHDNSAPVDLSKLSIEHLMPQTPTEEWLEELNTDEETYFENLHRLGNLTLTTKPDNSKMGNLNWEYKNAILKETAHLTLNTELIAIQKWTLDEIGIRTVGLIKRICEVYKYPEVNIKDDTIIDEKTSLRVAIKLGIQKNESDLTKCGSTYKEDKEENGYVVAYSKMYRQGEKEKYWFGYKKEKFEPIKNCKNQFLILTCRSDKTMVVRFPKTYISKYLDSMNISMADDGTPSHYHIVIFKEVDDRITMQLSKPDLELIDVTDYLVGIE